MNDLVQRLSTDTHPVTVSLRPTRSAEAFKACLDRGYVLVKFTDTQGGTELGVKLDPAASDTSRADFANATGTVTIAGDLTLDYVPVRCVAEIDVSTLTGTGRLQPRVETGVEAGTGR